MAPSAASAVINSAAIGAVIGVLASDVGLVTLVFVGVYAAALLPFFATSLGVTATNLGSFLTSSVVGLLIGAILGLLVAVVLDTTPMIQLRQRKRPSTPLQRIPYGLFAVIGGLAIVVGAVAFASGGPSSTIAWIALILGVLLFVGSLLALGLVVHDYATIVYVFIIALVAGVPAATFDYIGTTTRLGAAGVAFFVALIVYAIGAGVAYVAERSWPPETRFAAGSVRFGLAWIALLALVASIYFVGAAVDDSQTTPGDPDNADPVAAALFALFWVWIIVVVCCFGLLICIRAQPLQARRGVDASKKNDGDTESQQESNPDNDARSAAVKSRPILTEGQLRARLISKEMGPIQQT